MRAAYLLIFLIAIAMKTMAYDLRDDGCFSAITNERKVIVVGGGLAGMAAAIEAERAGWQVELIDKSASLGGNSAKASSGINAVGTDAQARDNVEDNIETFVKDTLESGHGLSDEKLVRLLAEQSASAVEFLSSFDIPLSVLSRCGGHSAPRTHRNGPDARGRLVNVGWVITSKLAEYLRSLPAGRVNIHTEAKLEQLLTDSSGSVIGITYSTKNSTTPIQLFADAVILATGGYSRDPELLAEFVPSLASFPSTNGPFANGDGVKAARKIGAALALMDQVQLHPTGLIDPKDPSNPTKFLGPEALRASGGIIVNARGERFVNELGLRDEVSKAILEQNMRYPVTEGTGYHFAYLFMNNAAVKQFQEQIFAFYQSKGLVVKYENAKEAAKALSFDYETFKKTIEDYNAAARGETKDPFNKKFFPVTFSLDEALYVLYITPSIHYTMGGLKIDENARVLSAEGGKPIPGLFAAGEVTGGLHGANRLAGNSLLECVVFGRIAGKQATGGAKSARVLEMEEAFDKIKAIVGDRFTTRYAVRMSHGKDHSYHQPRMPDAVVWPLTTEEVSDIVKICNKYTIPIIPYGVGSSLEGHTNALYGGITMNMTMMNKVVEYYEGDQQVVVQAGIRRTQLNEWLKGKNVFFPIDPGADASIGGMVATGASGTLAVGYGTMRDNVIRLKVVTPEGDIILTGSRARKSSAAYDLTHLFIGSEGTLGVITEITLKVYRIPVSVAAVCSFPDIESASRAIIKAKALDAGGHRMELLNTRAIEAVNLKFNRTYTLTPKLFLEFHGATEQEALQRSQRFEQVAKEFHAYDYSVATAEKERNDLWHARHGAYWASASLCSKCKLFVTDVCVPISRLADCILETQNDFAESSFGIPPILGHAGDGNFHIMLPVDVNNPQEMALAYKLNEQMVMRAISMDGTCTGEHGVGYGKAPFVHVERGEVAVELMKRIKNSFDPKNILNPGKIW